MDSKETIDQGRQSRLGNWHTRLRIAVAGALLAGFAVSPAGQRMIDGFVGHDLFGRCTDLEADMYDVIDRFKYDDSARFDTERRRIEARYQALECSFSTYSMYTLENRL